jgi:N-acetylmuramoyl-L-alanine amidase
MKKDLIILGTAHLGTTPGKCSPDGKFREAVWSREFVATLKPMLESYGLEVMIDWPDLSMGKGTTTSQELKKRVEIVNKEAAKKDKNVYYISTHVNAAGSQGKWLGARGWSAYTSPGRTISDTLAEFLWISAHKNLRHYKGFGTWEKGQSFIRSDMKDGDHDLEEKLYVLTKTKCPAVLVENMFQDNHDDIQYLTSDIGFHELQRTYVEGILWFLENR